MRSSKVVKIAVSPELLKKVEKAAKEDQRTRSELLGEALKRYLDDREWNKIYRYGEKKAKILGLKEGDVEGLVDETRK